MAKKANRKKTARRAGGEALLVWVKLPKGTSLRVPEARRSTLLTRLLRDAGKNPQAACFGGDTCIV